MRIRELRDISPVVSKRFTEPRLTPERMASFACVSFLSLRRLRTFCAIDAVISGGVFWAIIDMSMAIILANTADLVNYR